MHGMTGSVLEDRSLICAGQEAILSSSLHSWMVSETPKVLYLIGTVSCLPWRKIVVVWKWPPRVSWLRMYRISLPYLNRLYIRQAISTGAPAHLFRTLVAAWILSDKFHGRVFNVSWSLPSKSFQVHPANLILLSTLNANINKLHTHTQFTEHLARVRRNCVGEDKKRGKDSGNRWNDIKHFVSSNL